MALAAPVGGVGARFVDINADGRVDMVYSFSKGEKPGGQSGDIVTSTAVATYINTGGGFCLHYNATCAVTTTGVCDSPPRGFYDTWSTIAGSCICDAHAPYEPTCKSSEAYPPCPPGVLPDGALLATPCAMNAFYAGTPRTVSHGDFVDVNHDGYPDIVYSYVEGPGESAVATFFNVGGAGFCLEYEQEALQDQCINGARDMFPPCGGGAHSNMTPPHDAQVWAGGPLAFAALT